MDVCWFLFANNLFVVDLVIFKVNYSDGLVGEKEKYQKNLLFLMSNKFGCMCFTCALLFANTATVHLPQAKELLRIYHILLALFIIQKMFAEIHQIPFKLIIWTTLASTICRMLSVWCVGWVVPENTGMGRLFTGEIKAQDSFSVKKMQLLSMFFSNTIKDGTSSERRRE